MHKNYIKYSATRRNSSVTDWIARLGRAKLAHCHSNTLIRERFRKAIIRLEVRITVRAARGLGTIDERSNKSTDSLCSPHIHGLTLRVERDTHSDTQKYNHGQRFHTAYVKIAHAAKAL